MTTTEHKNLIQKLNDLKILQTESDWAENIPMPFWENYFKGNFKEVAQNLDVDTHRWYEISTTVVSLPAGLVGIRFVTNVFSESMDYEDCEHIIEFLEMKEIIVTSYEKV